MLKLIYKKPNGEEAERKFEPHIIAFHHGIWYAKGYEYGKKEAKSYAIQRITAAEFGGATFVSGQSKCTGYGHLKMHHL